MQLRITYSTATGGETVVTTTPFVIMAWERTCRTKMSAVFDTGLGMEDLLTLAWEATRAGGTTVPPFEQWAKTVTEIKMGGTDETVPTKPAASGD